MKTFLALILVGGVACLAADQPGSPRQHHHYVQVVRGSDLLSPPAPGATLVGAKVRHQLEPVFRWKQYWEMQRANLDVAAGQKGRVALIEGHSLEIDLSNPDKRTIRLYRGKKLVRTAIYNRDKHFCTQGIECADGTAWFIVVRTDPPAT